MSPESEIAILIVALYLFECARLLYANEVIIECTLSGYRALFPSERANFGGRLLHILNPAAPARACFLATWRLEPAPDGSRGDFATQAALAQALRPLTPLVALVGVLVLVCLPPWLLVFPVRDALPLLLLTYGVIAALLVRLWSIRAQIAMSSSKFAALAFQCIACPPLAPNIMRSITLGRASQDDLLNIAEVYFSTSECRRVCAELVERVSGQMASLEADAPEYTVRSRYLEQVRRMLLRRERRKRAAPIRLRAQKKRRRRANASEGL